MAIDYEFAGPHTIASDGDVYVVENTGRHEVIFFDNTFKFSKKFLGIGYRPHHTLYYQQTQSFFVVSAPYIFCFRKINGSWSYAYQVAPPFLENTYVRSIAIIDGDMYFTSGQNKIVVAKCSDDSFSLINEYPVPSELSGMNDIQKIGDYFYLTSSQNSSGAINPKIIRTQDLTRLALGDYEDIYSTIGFTQTPYFISVFDDRVYLTEIGDDRNGVFSFPVTDIELKQVRHDINFIGITSDDIKRRDMYPR